MVDPAQTLARTENWERLQATQLEVEILGNGAPTWQQLGQQLRAEGLTPDSVNAITAQLQLRREAQDKFGDTAKHMLFTRDGLEQATRMPIAFLHAFRFVRAQVNGIADLGCGIGADALAFAEAGLRVIALDRDPEAVACAAVNLRQIGDAEVILGDVNDVTPAWLSGKGVTGIFLDPARRAAGKRVLRPEDWSPPWGKVQELFGWGYPAGAKLAPGIDHQALTFGSLAQWTSVEGELVEAALWSKELSPEGPGRSAQLINANGVHVLKDPETPSADAPVRPAAVGTVDEYVFEPDSAVIRSGALAYLAEQTGTHLIHSRIAYMSGNSAPDSPFLTGFKVEEIVKLREKQVLQALNRLEAGSVEVKKRGAQIDPDSWQRNLRRRLKTPGGRPLVVIATQTDNGHAAIIASRLRGAKTGR